MQCKECVRNSISTSSQGYKETGNRKSSNQNANPPYRKRHKHTTSRTEQNRTEQSGYHLQILVIGIIDFEIKDNVYVLVTVCPLPTIILITKLENPMVLWHFPCVPTALQIRTKRTLM